MNEISLEVIAFTITNGASALLCLVAAILVCSLKLHKKATYRLSLYQVLSALGFATVQTFQIVSYKKHGDFYTELCTALGWLVVYTQTTKLLFTMILTLHLFCLSVCDKNLQRFEPWYVCLCLFVPFVVAFVPLTTGNYGKSRNGRCYIQATLNNTTQGIIERFVIWDGPAMIILLASSVAMIVIVTKIAARLLRSKMKSQPLTSNDSFQRAFKQILPLAAFPILYCMFAILPAVLNITSVTNTAQYVPKALKILNGVLISLWSMAAALTLLIHVCAARCKTGQRKGARNRTYAYRAVNEIGGALQEQGMN